MNRILTRKEWEQSVAETFSAAVESTYKSLLDEAVRQEREAIAEMVEDWDSDSADPRDIAAAIRARSNT